MSSWKNSKNKFQSEFLEEFVQLWYIINSQNSIKYLYTEFHI